MADSNYDPFRGFVGAKPSAKGGKKELGSRLKAVDWDKASAPTGGAKGGKWVVFDAKKVADIQKAAKKAATDAKNAPRLTQEEVDAWRTEHNITIHGDECPYPLTEFTDLTMMPPYIQAAFKKQGFERPTPIQSQSWPILFGGRDMVGIAKTGSGKTLSFIVPALSHISVAMKTNGGSKEPICVVLAPTRELAQQIEAETRKVLPTQIKCTCIYGGAAKGPQLAELAEKPQIVVATPGRLIDFLEIKRINLMSVTYLVLDEADRMLDMGFEPQVRQICGQIPPMRQTLMFSATWPKEIQDLASQFQKDFIRIHVGSTELLANPDVKQQFRFCRGSDKVAELRNIMEKFRHRRMIIFVKTKKCADNLEKLLKGHGFNALAIHGDKEQRQREYILDKFRRDPTMCLVATDVAARGLDVKQLEVVINYDFAMSVEDYVHRIGRTGRAGAKGDAFSILTREEQHMNPSMVKELIAVLEKANQDIPTELREWAAESSYKNKAPAPSEGYAGGQRGRPGLHYKHSSRPSGAPSGRGASSFDPSGSGGGAGLFGTSGGANGGGPNKFPFGRPPKQAGDKRSRSGDGGSSKRMRQ